MYNPTECFHFRWSVSIVIKKFSIKHCLLGMSRFALCCAPDGFLDEQSLLCFWTRVHLRRDEWGSTSNYLHWKGAVAIHKADLVLFLLWQLLQGVVVPQAPHKNLCQTLWDSVYWKLLWTAFAWQLPPSWLDRLSALWEADLLSSSNLSLQSLCALNKMGQTACSGMFAKDSSILCATHLCSQTHEQRTGLGHNSLPGVLSWQTSLLQHCALGES